MPPCREPPSSQPQPCDEAVNCLADSAGISVQRPAAAPAGAAADRLERARGSEPVTPSASEIAPRSPAATSEGIALIEVVEETL